jgi:hypothetical protein
MSQAANAIFGQAGLSVRMSPRGQGVMRDYWYAMNESPMHWGLRIARELGMHFRIVGDQAIFADMDESFGTIVAKWSENLIAWAIYPFAARAQWGESNSQFFNFGQATWTIMNQMLGGSSAPCNFAEAAKVLPHPAPNASVADQDNDGQGENSDSMRGSGHVVINGEPCAKPSMTRWRSSARARVSTARTTSSRPYTSIRGRDTRPGSRSTGRISPAMGRASTRCPDLAGRPCRRNRRR